MRRRHGRAVSWAVLVWCDKQPVLILSTHQQGRRHGPYRADNRGPSSASCRHQAPGGVGLQCWQVLVWTRSISSGSPMLCRGSPVKDWPSLAWWLIDICIINSYTLWCLDTGANMGQLDFRHALRKQILAAHPPPAHRRHRRVPNQPPTTGEGHWPKHSHVPRRCKQCYGPVAGEGGAR